MESLSTPNYRVVPYYPDDYLMTVCIIRYRSKEYDKGVPTH